MNIVVMFRFLLPLLGVVGILVAIRLIKPQKKILYHSLSMCWAAGILNLIVDAIQQHYRFWHYTVSGLIFGFPLDLYIAVSLVIGVILPLIYWKLRSFHKKWTVLYILILPFYFLLQDYLVIKATGDTVLRIESPYWLIADFIALIVILWGTLFIFNYFLPQRD